MKKNETKQMKCMKRRLFFAAVFLLSVVHLHAMYFWKPGGADFQEGDFCYKYTYNDVNFTLLNSDKVVLTAYTGTAKTVNVPSSVTHSGITYTVVAIGKRATVGMTMDEYTGYGVTPAQYWAFYGTNVETINEIPATVEQLENFDSGSRYAYNFLEGCHKLKKILINTDNPVYSTTNAYGFNSTGQAVYTNNNKWLIAVPPGCEDVGLTIKDGVEMICKYALYQAKFKNIAMPNSVKEIENHAFNSCTNLTNLKMSDAIETIGTRAFERCVKLNPVDLPEGLKNIYSYAFKDCSALETIKLPASLVVLGRGAFQYCENLDNVEFRGDLITKIEDNVFHYCTNMKTVSLPSTLKEIGQFSFCACSSLENDFLGNYPNLMKIGRGAFNCSSLESVTPPESVTSIGDYAFGCNKNLKKFTIPTNCTLGKGVLMNTPYLSEIVNLNTTRYTLDKSGGLTKGVLYGNNSGPMDELIYFIPLNEIGQNNKTMVKQWIVPNHVKKICAGSMGYHQIESLILPSGLEEIEEYAFSQILDDQGRDPFIQFSEIEREQWRWRVKELTIPASVKNLKMNAFFSLINPPQGASQGFVAGLTKTTHFEKIYFMSAPETFNSNTSSSPFVYNYGNVYMVLRGSSFFGDSKGTCEGDNDEVKIYTTKSVYEGNSSFTRRMKKYDAFSTDRFGYEIPFDRTIYYGKVMTMCRDFDMDLSNTTAYHAFISEKFDADANGGKGGYTMRRVSYVPSRTGSQNDEYHGIVVRGQSMEGNQSETFTYRIGENHYRSTLPIATFKSASDGSDIATSMNRLVGVVANSHVQGSEGTLTNWGLSDGKWQRIVNTGRLTPYNRAYLQPTKAETNSMIGSDGQHAKINMIFADEEVDWIGITGIECQNVEHLDKDRWHTLDGRVLKQRPTEKGIYIHNGKKEVVK